MINRNLVIDLDVNELICIMVENGGNCPRPEGMTATQCVEFLLPEARLALTKVANELAAYFVRAIKESGGDCARADRPH